MTQPTRRAALLSAAGAGLTVSFLGRQAFAASQGDMARRKLVVIVCRGAMDGLSVAPPVGDPDYAALRGEIAIPGFAAADGALKLDDTFGLHPRLTAVHALALKGQARIAPAVATPDRARSHFEAQDVLESGSGALYAVSSGWLNRTLEALAPARRIEALSVGAQAPLILRGRIQAASWAPGGYKDRDARLPGILADLYADDPLLAGALASGREIEAMAKLATAVPAVSPMASQTVAMSGAAPRPTPALAQVGQAQAVAAKGLGTTLAHFMTEPNGPQVAALSLDGFDTHANQGASQGQLANRLLYLDAVIDGLASGLGPEWNNTVVLVATEFGRTARINGTKGTDHGTASTALVLGGALRRGGIIGDWPTLQQAKLFENRDTAPTLDMRALFKGVLAEQLGVDKRALDEVVFPGSGDVAGVRGIVA
jgi:uncharacterized protein (DUF1501 family)